MPRLACWSCGRQIYTVSPLESLFAEERRCPRCGSTLRDERRGVERRAVVRRQNPAAEPGPTGPEQRGEDRRQVRRRKNPADGSNRTGGWTTR
jgi:DNA-directed RNA polymerase subunit RPC12/RpoP